MNYGQVIKIKKNGKVAGKNNKKVYGNPNIDEIETTNIIPCRGRSFYMLN